MQQIVRQLPPFDPCRGYMTFVICTFGFTACNATTGRLLPICFSDCPFIDYILEECSSEFHAGDPNYPGINQLLYPFPCLEPPAYYNFPAQYIETDPSQCLGFGK